MIESVLDEIALDFWWSDIQPFVISQNDDDFEADDIDEPMLLGWTYKKIVDYLYKEARQPYQTRLGSS